MSKDFKERKEKVYGFICDDLYVPMKVKEIATLLQVSKADRPDLDRILEELILEGKIEISKRGKYSKAEKKVLTGTFMSTRQVFGFIGVDGLDEDYFVSGNHTGGAMNGDLVEFELCSGKRGKRLEAKVVKVLERATKETVGTFEKSTENYGFVRSDDLKFDKDIFVPKERSMGAEDGHKVVVEIMDYGDENHKPEGRITEIIGFEDEVGNDVLCVAKAYGLPMEFSPKIQTQVQNVAQQVSEQDIEWRMDLRDWDMVTIDGEDAKDLDDAVSLTYDGTNYTLGVHIADVSNYVQEGSALDQEALKRGTSVYLVDRVIPMLPFQLSNGICSLNAGQNRLAMSCIMTINDQGEIIGHQVAETVIRVNERMTYTSVRKILEDHDPEEMERYKDLVPMFQMMGELSLKLRERRHKRGAIDFDFPETKVIVNDEGKVTDIVPHEANCATRLIEDFMLAANETIAEDFFWQQSPFVYRTHETPDPERILQLQSVLKNFGYGMKTARTKDEIHPKEIQKLLARVEGEPEEALISRLALRSLKQARYTTECNGHFGLAAQYYCHFTSPIRRYPDLQIHRIIKENLRGKMNAKRREHYENILPGVAQQSSERERRADEVERETNKMKKAEYMADYIGEEYDGVISSITSWGIYVELPNTIEGMVRIADMSDDFYNFFEDSYQLVGETTGKIYKLGQPVRVKVLETNKALRTIDFELVD